MITTKETRHIDRDFFGRRDITETRILVPTQELAHRLAVWHGFIRNRDKVTGRVEIRPRGKASPIRALVITDEEGREMTITQTAMSRYFVYTVGRTSRRYYSTCRLEQEGAYLWETEGDSNCWMLAEWFSI